MSDDPLEPTSFERLALQPELQDLAYLDVPTPDWGVWDGDNTAHEELLSEEYVDPIFEEGLVELFSESFRSQGNSDPTIHIGSPGIGVNYARDVVTHIPSPADAVEVLVRGLSQVNPEESAKAVENLKDRRAPDYKDNPNQVLERNIASFEAHANSEQVLESYDHLLEVLYGDRYKSYKDTHGNPFAEPEVADSSISSQERNVFQRATSEAVLPGDQAVLNDRGPIIDRPDMEKEFGMHGRLDAIIQIGEGDDSYELAIVDVRDAPQGYYIWSGHGYSRKIFDDENSLQVETDYVLAVINKDGSIDKSKVAGIPKGKRVMLTGQPEDLPLSDYFFSTFGGEKPGGVSQSQCELELNNDGDILFTNGADTSASVKVERSAKHGARPKLRTNL